MRIKKILLSLGIIFMISGCAVNTTNTVVITQELHTMESVYNSYSVITKMEIDGVLCSEESNLVSFNNINTCLNAQKKK